MNSRHETVTGSPNGTPDAADPALAPPPVARIVEDIIGCKWSLAVIGAVRRGVQRPGAIEHAIDGLSKRCSTSG